MYMSKVKYIVLERYIFYSDMAQQTQMPYNTELITITVNGIFWIALTKRKMFFVFDDSNSVFFVANTINIMEIIHCPYSLPKFYIIIGWLN